MTSVEQNIGRYRIVERIGRGAIGVLYRGIDPVLERDVAIKVMSAEFASDGEAAGEESKTRFFREARAAAKLQHRNIVTIFEFAEEKGVPYIVMEFLRGRSLADRMRAEPRLALDETLDIVTELCTGLQFAHDHGVIHRNVKPANVWLLEDGTVKLLDFGIVNVSSATVARQGDMLGSAPYMAPEQLRGEPLDARADVFAASIVLYELLAGRQPFESESPSGTHQRILHEELPPLASLVPDLPAPLAAAVTKGLQKNADARYQSAADLGADLQLIRMSLQSSGDTPFVEDAGSEETLYGELADQRTEATMTAAASRAATPAVVGRTMPVEAPRPAIDAAPLSPAPSPRGRWIGALAVTVIMLAGVGWYGSTRFSTPPSAIDAGQAAADSGGATAVAVDPSAVTIEARGSYPFEITDGQRVLSTAAIAHAISAQPGQVLRLRETGYLLDYPFKIDGGQRQIRVTAPELGRLTVRTTRTGCQVIVNGHDFGLTPVNSRLVAAGTYSVQLKCADGQIVRGSGVTVVPGQTTIASVP